MKKSICVLLKLSLPSPQYKDFNALLQPFCSQIKADLQYSTTFILQYSISELHMHIISLMKFLIKYLGAKKQKKYYLLLRDMKHVDFLKLQPLCHREQTKIILIKNFLSKKKIIRNSLYFHKNDLLRNVAKNTFISISIKVEKAVSNSLALYNGKYFLAKS